MGRIVRNAQVKITAEHVYLDIIITIVYNLEIQHAINAIRYVNHAKELLYLIA